MQKATDASKATNPSQYDSPEINWQKLGSEDARKYFRDILGLFIESGYLEGKRVLDIGSGVGHLFGWLKDRGVVAVTGIDPATQNIATSKEKYPWATSVVATLSEFAQVSKEKFDVAICILAFEHIYDLNEGFRDVNSLLKAGGRFYLIICDKDYSISNDQELRSQGFVSVEIIRDLGNGGVETRTVRRLIDGSLSTMYDIFRPIEQVRAAAQANGFRLFAEKPLMSPTANPVPMLYVLGFKKSA